MNIGVHVSFHLPHSKYCISYCVLQNPGAEGSASWITLSFHGCWQKAWVHPVWLHGLPENLHNVAGFCQDKESNSKKAKPGCFLQPVFGSYISCSRWFHRSAPPLWKRIVQRWEYQETEITEGRWRGWIQCQQQTIMTVHAAVIKHFCRSLFHFTISQFTNISLIRRVTSRLEIRKTVT